MLNEHGIETYISNARSYKGNRRSNYSYTELARGEAGAQAAIWIVLPSDITRARQLLRDAGLIESTRPPTFLPAPVVAAKEAPRASPWPMRLRLILLAAIAIGAMLVLSRAW